MRIMLANRELSFLPWAVLLFALLVFQGCRQKETTETNRPRAMVTCPNGQKMLSFDSLLSRLPELPYAQIVSKWKIGSPNYLRKDTVIPGLAHEFKHYLLDASRRRMVEKPAFFEGAGIRSERGHQFSKILWSQPVNPAGRFERYLILQDSAECDFSKGLKWGFLSFSRLPDGDLLIFWYADYRLGKGDHNSGVLMSRMGADGTLKATLPISCWRQSSPYPYDRAGASCVYFRKIELTEFTSDHLVQADTIYYFKPYKFEIGSAKILNYYRVWSVADGGYLLENVESDSFPAALENHALVIFKDDD